ncbi:MAG: hypothetical protein LC122_03250 [Chitinophagales bacterium]|nr:hypothetical protein [Chitinophagales bacterium]
MKVYYLAIIFLGCFFFTACSSNNQKCKAKIIERKAINDSTIQIRYNYVVSDKVFDDSLQTKNKIINSDSLIINFSSENPQNHTVDIP